MHSIAKHAISTDVVSKTELFIIPARTALGCGGGTLIIGLSAAGEGGFNSLNSNYCNLISK